MSKVSKLEAFYEITKAMNNNEIDRANAMFKIVSESISSDNNSFSEFIELKGKKQEQLFKDIIIPEDETI